MKKILFLAIFLCLPTYSFSEDDSITRLGINYVDLEVDYGWVDASVDGWGISLDSAINSNVLLTLDWFKLEDANFNVISANYAFGDLSEGAFTLGIARFDSDVADSSSSDVEIGYSKRSGEMDFTLGIITSEETTFRAKVMTPVGISFGVLTDGDVSLWNLGYDFKF